MPDGSTFEPAPELRAFLHHTFILKGAPFHRPEYEHLVEAKIAVLWTNRERVKDGLMTLGMAQLYRASGDKWTAGVGQQQVLRWFSSWWDDPQDPFPDFVLYFYAPAVAAMNDPTACALFAHELRHCAQKRDRWGEPMFDENGDPVFAIQGHDVEQFVSVVEDFGIEAAGQAGLAFVEAAQRPPRFGHVEVAGVCGCGAQLQAVA
jgi:hypothetical protein